MYKVIIAGSVAAYVSAFHPINQEHVDSIKLKTSNWEPHTPETNPLANKTVEELMAMCGTWNVPHNGMELVQTTVGAYPAEWDPRPASHPWSKFIHPIRDQQSCGSCWAFGATEYLTDRFAINSKGAVDVILSPQDMVSCDKNDFGCSGGYMDKANQYLVNSGVVSEACYPYTSGSGQTGTCRTTCVNSQPFKKYKCSKSYHVVGVEAIKTELSSKGPVEGAFTVY
jgi:cathepsin B